MADSEKFQKVKIRCPNCGKMGEIQISKDVITSSERGVCAIEVHKNKICPHSFITYVDKNFIARDYFIPDITLENIEIVEEKEPAKKIKPAEQIKKISDEDYSFVRSILQRNNFTYIIHAILMKKPIHLICEVIELHDKIIKVFGEIAGNSFKPQISVGIMEEFNSKKESYKDFLILHLDSEMFLENHYSILSPKDLNFEAEIIKKTFNQSDPTTSLIVLKNELQKLRSLAENVEKMLREESGKGKKKWNKKDVINELNRRNKIKISTKYLYFVLEIIKRNFDFEPSDYLKDVKD
jgi:hypothetical protein